MLGMRLRSSKEAAVARSIRPDALADPPLRKASACDIDHLPIALADIEAAAATLRGAVIVTECTSQQDPQRDGRLQRLAQIREPSVDCLLQGTWRAEPA